MTILFGKLREHELELNRLTAEEDQGRKNTLAFKYEISKGKSSRRNDDDDTDDEENMSLMIKKFAKFMRAKGKDKYREERKENQGSQSSIRCYGCGERGHVKTDCPNNKKGEEKKERKFPKKKKAYIA
ncbi:protein PXR1-like [Vigna umbellata]|uniref:protein PXR1-like n=1 Tax=Vigna umbellata TaxID=87088 RepID=UPI001F5F4735|nr:protein PXR1-like [Vigna umbellata]